MSELKQKKDARDKQYAAAAEAKVIADAKVRKIDDTIYYLCIFLYYDNYIYIYIYIL